MADTQPSPDAHAHDSHCPHCGADRDAGRTCPVCELAYDAHEIKTAPTLIGALWQSGRLAVGLAAALLLLSMLVPFATMTSTIAPRPIAIPVTLVDMMLQSGPLAREVKSFTVVAVPLAAALMAQFLFSRKTAGAMRATRPLLFVLSALPLFAMVTGYLRLSRAHRYVVALGVAPWLVAVAAVFGVIGAVQFGTGVPEKRRRAQSVQASDDD